MTKMLMIFVDETALWQEDRLYAAIVRQLHRHSVAGATAVPGFMGYGLHRRIHKRGLLGVTDERPVLIMAVDEEQRLQRALEDIRPMVEEGLITLIDAQVISNGAPHRDEATS